MVDDTKPVETMGKEPIEGEGKQAVDEEIIITEKEKPEEEKNTELIEKKVEELEPKKEIPLPTTGKLISEFATELIDEIKDKNVIFFRTDSREIVEIGKIKLKETDEYKHTGFLVVNPNKFITLCEQYFTPVVYVKNKETYVWEYKRKSMNAILSKTLICSEIIQNSIPQINRIFTIPIPILYNGKLTFPKKGYDSRFNSWMPENAPEITNREMPVEEAKEIIYSIFKEFCFESHQDYINAIAGLLTPFIRGLLPSFSTRTPVFFYIANRERAGKDYLAGITGILYEGHALEESPISTSENAKTNNTDELRKKILSAMISGRKRMHFSNNKGYINNAVFEAVITAEQYSDRILGRSELLTFDNELDFSLSGNTGIGFTSDLANRSRFVRLFLAIEDANMRKFENPKLHNYILENRELILSAFYALIRNWYVNDCVVGSVPYTSFNSWAEVCGGIMEAAGWSNPCVADTKITELGGDKETNEMKELFELCYEKYPEAQIKKSHIKELLQTEDTTIFGYFDFENKAEQTKFGLKLTKFIDRVLSNIRLSVVNMQIRGNRREYKFTKTQPEDVKNIFEEDEKDIIWKEIKVCTPCTPCTLNTPLIYLEEVCKINRVREKVHKVHKVYIPEKEKNKEEKLTTVGEFIDYCIEKHKNYDGDMSVEEVLSLVEKSEYLREDADGIIQNRIRKGIYNVFKAGFIRQG